MMASTCPAFVASSFALRTAIHVAHLTTKSYAQHIALGDFYDSLEDLTDKYAEVYMGLEDEVPTFPMMKPPSGAPVELLEDYLEAVKEEQAEDNDSEALKNILAEIEELTARTLYKLRNLQ